MPADHLAPGSVLGLYDGGSPTAAQTAVCARHGLDLLPYVECMPLGPGPHMRVGAASQWRLNHGLSPDYSGFVELAPGRSEERPDAWEDCVAAAAAGGLGVSLTSAAAYGHDIPCPFVAAIGRRFPGAECLPALELALYEALANAIIHGNLGIDSGLRATVAGLRDYRRALAHALTDPDRAQRRVIVTCVAAGPLLRLTVRDQGAGWDVHDLLAHGPAREAKSGRGLDLIRQVTATVRAEDDGRRLIMEFRR